MEADVIDHLLVDTYKSSVSVSTCASFLTKQQSFAFPLNFKDLRIAPPTHLMDADLILEKLQVDTNKVMNTA